MENVYCAFPSRPTFFVVIKVVKNMRRRSTMISQCYIQGGKGTCISMFISSAVRSKNNGPRVPSSICLMKYFSYRNSKDMCGAIEGPVVFSSQLNGPSWKFHLGVLPWKSNKNKDKGVCFCTRYNLVILVV